MWKRTAVATLTIALFAAFSVPGFVGMDNALAKGQKEQAVQTFTFQESVPLSGEIDTAQYCGDSQGEVVTFSGAEHAVIHTTTFGAKLRQVAMNHSYQNVSGKGETSGLSYQVNATFHQVTTNILETVFVENFTRNVEVISAGADYANLLIRERFHFVVKYGEEYERPEVGLELLERRIIPQCVGS